MNGADWEGYEMAKRIGVFVDVSNLYYCISKKFQDRKLDYAKYWDFIKELGDIQQAIAYGAQVNNEASNFIYCLKQVGFLTKYKSPKSYSHQANFKRKADWDVGIAIDIVNMIDRFDMIILGTADGDLVPAVEWAQQRGVDVVVFACGISRDLKNIARQFIEIPESLLEEAGDDTGTKEPRPVSDTDDDDTGKPDNSSGTPKRDDNTGSEVSI